MVTTLRGPCVLTYSRNNPVRITHLFYRHGNWSLTKLVSCLILSWYLSPHGCLILFPNVLLGLTVKISHETEIFLQLSFIGRAHEDIDYNLYKSLSNLKPTVFDWFSVCPPYKAGVECKDEFHEEPTIRHQLYTVKESGFI